MLVNFLFKDIAEIAEDEGIQMITFHPRTVSKDILEMLIGI